MVRFYAYEKDINLGEVGVTETRHTNIDLYSCCQCSFVLMITYILSLSSQMTYVMSDVDL